MSSFIKFCSILSFGVFCFVGGVAEESGHGVTALYCVIGGTGLLLNGLIATVVMKANEIDRENHKKTEELLKETIRAGRRLRA